MKLGGIRIDGPRVETVVIPFAGKDLVFKAQLVQSFEDFDKLCPRPVPPSIQRPGEQPALDVEDPGYRTRIAKWAGYRTRYTILKSLQATPDLEWGTVDASKPETWDNMIVELLSSGLSQMEINRIHEIVWTANGLDQEKIDEATKRFLAGEADARREQSFLKVDPSGTPSGEPAKG